MRRKKQSLSRMQISYFEDPFWVGVFERIENGKLTVASEKTDARNRHWNKIATGVEVTAGTEQAGA